jgi:hypothetical protein
VENDSLGGDLSTAKAYVHALYRAESTYTDLQFWFFYAFNGHASLAASLEVGIGPISKSFSLDQSINPIGEHYGDWECCMIRIDNIKKSMIGIWLSQHSGGQYFNKFGLPAFEKNGKAAIVYASNNGHAVFSETGNNITEGINKSLGVAKIKAGLYNVTGKGGKSLDSRTRYEVVATNWLEKDFPEKRWVAYPYRWGPTGGTPYDLQKVIDTIIRALPGPANIGPVRDLISEVVRKIAGALPDNVDGPEGPALKDQWRGIYG